MDIASLGLLLIVPAFVLGLVSWPEILRTVQQRGLDYPSWGGHGVVLTHFRQILRAKQDPTRRNQYRRWLWMTYAATGLMLLWIVNVLLVGVQRG